MDYRDLTNLLLKVAGIAIIVYVVIEIPALIAYYGSFPNSTLWIVAGMIVVSMLAPLIAGFIFLFFPTTVSNKLIRGEKSSNAENFDLQAIERITFSALGLYLLFRVISDFTYHGATFFLMRDVDGLSSYNTGHEHPYALLFSTIAEFIFALYLLFGSAGLVKLLAKLRRG